MACDLHVLRCVVLPIPKETILVLDSSIGRVSGIALLIIAYRYLSVVAYDNRLSSLRRQHHNIFNQYQYEERGAL